MTEHDQNITLYHGRTGILACSQTDRNVCPTNTPVGHSNLPLCHSRVSLCHSRANGNPEIAATRAIRRGGFETRPNAAIPARFTISGLS